MTWKDLQAKYAIIDEEAELFKAVERKRAFWDLDAQIILQNLNVALDCADGPALDPTDEEVERILDEYLEWRYSDFAIADETDDMRRAIKNVTGLIC